jgi:uncharacterized membrane protein YhaH (DUF805 family)
VRLIDQALQSPWGVQTISRIKLSPTDFVGALGACFVNYATFKGCASRAEFWWWFVFTLVVTAALRGLSHNLAAVFSFATFLPSIAVTARRLHDVDRSGWWQLLYFLPVVGWIVLIFFCAEPTQPNRHEV